MANAHRTNVLVTSCLKTPVDPQTKTPLASYERSRVLPSAHWDNRDYEKELEYEDSGSDFYDEDYLAKGDGHLGRNYGADRFDLREIFFSNEEYYKKLEELKKAHLRTMAELESMYRQKLQLKSTEPLDTMVLDQGHRSLLSPGPAGLRRSISAVELRWGEDFSDEDQAECSHVEKGLEPSPKEHIQNMWKNFTVTAYEQRACSSSLRSSPAVKRKAKQDPSKNRVTVPKPFHMTKREAEKQQRSLKSRLEAERVEHLRQAEQLKECQRKFRASPVPAHVHLPLYAELQERRRTGDEKHLRIVQKPFSFLERERLKKEKKELQEAEHNKAPPFKAKPVPRWMYTAGQSEQQKEEQLYRSIKTQMRAQETLLHSSLPPSMLERRLSERKKNKDPAAEGDGNFSHRPQINREVPDFDASYRRFQKNLERRKEVKPTTACEPFELRTSQICSYRGRGPADTEQCDPPRMLRWPHLTPNSSLCSSLSGSLELLPAKPTDATKKRHDAVRYLITSPDSSTIVVEIVQTPRKVLEQRKKAEEEEERWREKQKQRERKLQRVVQKRAQANDPHLALSQTHQSKIKEFRKQELQRRKEYQQEIKEMHQRVKGRPLLLEQVAQRNAKHAAEKRYAETLQGCNVTEEFISGKAAESANKSEARPSGGQQLSDQDDPEVDLEPVSYRKVFLDDEDVENLSEKSDRGEDEEDQQDSDHSYHYSDDHESYSEDSEHEADSGKRRDDNEHLTDTEEGKKS